MYVCLQYSMFLPNFSPVFAHWKSPCFSSSFIIRPQKCWCTQRLGSNWDLPLFGVELAIDVPVDLGLAHPPPASS